MHELHEHDHRRLGRSLDLFHLQDEAAGSVFWHPKGWTLFLTIEAYLRDRLKKNGYVEVRTPQIIDRSLWEKSGHWDKFRANMFTVAENDGPADECGVPAEGRVFAVKPMNCPGHVQIFNASTVSYRQLPMRMAEFGCCHRNEPSGALHGIMRVRQFTQDDAHIFCTEDQIEAETKAFCDLLTSVYQDFGFTDVTVGFSTRPASSAGDDDTWERAEAALAAAVQAAGLTYTVYPGEGAFYGPKLEFALTDAKGRSWQCGTLQLDFVLPKRLGAEYAGADGKRHQPVMLHRAILGSLERFIGILLEHHEGHLPLWLAPVQVAVVSVKPESNDYAKHVQSVLSDSEIRVVLDDRDENMSQKIKEHSEAKVPLIVTVGPRDERNGTANLRWLGQEPQTVPLDTFVSDISLFNAPNIRKDHP